MALLDLQLRDFLDEVAAEGKTPGGGSLAALVTAAAAGLLAKVARTSRGEWAEAAGIAAQAEALRDRAAPLAQLDAEAYEAALRSVEQSGDEAGDRRDYAVGRAYAQAAEPPLRIVEAAGDVAELSVTVARSCDPSLRADAAAAGALAAAAARAAAELVAVNLTYSADDERVRRVRRLARDAARSADEAFADGERRE
jgi:methenyltetrahydrofolate cyclohydrolase